MSRQEAFARIKQAYTELDSRALASGSLPMRSTERGFWGASNLDDVYAFFEEKSFASSTRFLDLGCGDGRVVLVASLFVQAAGVEFDARLVEQAHSVADALGMDVQLIADDMRNVDFSSYDVLYSYADQRWDFIKHKLLRELDGELYCYHDTYHPRFLDKGRITWVGQIPIFLYTNPSSTDA